MTVSPLDSTIHGALLSDEETAAFFSDTAQVRAMLAVEAALARAQGTLGVIPSAAAAVIADTAEALQVAPEGLATGTAEAGVPVVALVARLREAAGGEAGRYLHWGATSQDIVDTALILRLGGVLALFAERLDGLIDRLAALAEEHRGTVMAARTRSQQATPTSFGLKLAGWAAPLARHRRRLAELQPRLLVVQLGGAAGTLAALGDRGIAVMEGLAAELELTAPVMPWHTQRDVVAELAGWLSLVSGSLGKLGQDIVLLAQSEVGEVRVGAGGSSSTMPQKANPVAAEVLVALARLNAGLLASVHQAMIQEHERSGAAWSLEWLTLPQMAVATGAALRHAQGIADTLVVDPERMTSNLAASNGLVLAEAASFALARHMPWPEAQALVESACRAAAADGRPLMGVLSEMTDAPVDWQELGDPASYLGSADALIDRAIAALGIKSEEEPG